jgi:polysaccharide pyruvyl transferase CsaB
MRYLLGGYYGMRNAGDDLLLYVTLAEVSRIDPDASFTIVSEHAELVPAEIRVNIARSRRFENLRQLRKHDVWLFGGGGLLQDASPRSRRYLVHLARTARLARLLGRKIVMVGIGIGPLTTVEGRAAAASLLRSAHLVTVRHDEGRALAAEMAPSVTVHDSADLGFLLPKHVGLPSVTPVDKVLGVSLLPHAASVGRPRAEDDRLVDSMAKSIDTFLSAHTAWSVRLFDFFSGSADYADADVLQAVQRRLAERDRVSYRSYRGDFIALHADLAACSAFVGMRFHSCILAYLARVPCLMIAYHPKSEHLARRLELHPEAVATLAVAQDSGALSGRLDHLVRTPDVFRPRVDLEWVEQQAGRSFGAFTDWVRDGAASITAPAAQCSAVELSVRNQ